MVVGNEKSAAESRFSGVRDHYTILRLKLSEFRATPHPLPNGFRLGEAPEWNALRDQEKDLLRQNFTSWESPFYGRVPGWRTDSPVFMVEGSKLVAAIYLCDRNEFDNSIPWGQLHYFFVDHAYRGRGIHSILFA